MKKTRPPRTSFAAPMTEEQIRQNFRFARKNGHRGTETESKTPANLRQSLPFWRAIAQVGHYLQHNSASYLGNHAREETRRAKQIGKASPRALEHLRRENEKREARAAAYRAELEAGSP